MEWRIMLELRSIELQLPVLESDRLILRMATKYDAAAILQFHLQNKHFLAPFEPARTDEFYTLPFWQDHIERALVEFNYDHAIKFCVFKKTDPQVLIAKINFTQFVRGAFHACILGYSLSEIEQGKGYMTEALKTAIHYLFNEQNFHRIMANYMPRNQRSGNVLRRLGFLVEGYARDYLLINNQWEDHILTSLTNPNWQQV
jgi:[ribosomal protein S5]-alanine N-acetyltransferase